MAFSANNVVVPNRTFTSQSFPFSKLPKCPRLTPSSFHQFHRRITMSAAASSSSSSVAKTVSDVEVQDTDTVFNAPSTNSWPEFAKNVSGEWDGYGADFTKEGKPIELPERVVPEAFREWEVKVFDWQTQCPTLAQPDDNHHLIYKLIKLLPTVGCEADAATQYTVDERNIGGGGGVVDDKVSASSFAYQSSGSYVAVWHMKDHLELEHCLVDPRNRESRVRVIQVVSAGGGGGGSKKVLRNIEVFCEQWYGPYRNGEQLGGCAIRDSAFASTDALIGSEVTGVWRQTHISVARFSNSPHSDLVQELVEEDVVGKYVRDECELILLPKQLWCSLKETENGEMCSEVGWLLDEGRDAITSRCIFSSDAKLKEVAVARESAVLEGL